MASGLAELQEALQRDIRHRTNDTAARLKVPSGAKADGRLAVYQNAYKLRLLGIIESEYPVLKAFMDETEFFRLVNRYIDESPSSHPNARIFPNGLPRFLEMDGRYADQGILRDIAALENAFSCAFDAPDAPIVNMEDLAMFPAEEIAEMQLRLSPALSLMTLSTNAEAICEAVWEEAEMPASRTRDVSAQLLVWRQELGSKYRLVDSEEAMLITETLAGKTFGGLCEMAAFYGNADSAPARIAAYLSQWINSQMVCELCIAGRIDEANRA